LNTDIESIPMTDAGSEFQTDGEAHRKNVSRSRWYKKNMLKIRRL